MSYFKCCNIIPFPPLMNILFVSSRQLRSYRSSKNTPKRSRPMKRAHKLTEWPSEVALVTGAGSGLGRCIVEELCRRGVQHVYLTDRNCIRAERVIKELNAQCLYPQFLELDITDPNSVGWAASQVRGTYGHLDLLVNCAAILDYNNVYPDVNAARLNIDTNYRSLLTIEKYMFPLLRSGARVVNVSSACGTLANLRNETWLNRLKSDDLKEEDLEEFVEWYLKGVQDGVQQADHFADKGKHAEHRVSKIALTALTMIWAKKYKPRCISVNALHPGHMQTPMARGGGKVPPAHAALLATYLLLEAPPLLSGAFLWYDRSHIDWKDHTSDYYYVHEDLTKEHEKQP